MQRRAKKTCRILLFLLPILFARSASAGVDCSAVPHTRLELAVCSEPLLRALDGELTDALQEALERGVIDKRSKAEQRNRIARQCRREASSAYNACLLDAELRCLEWVAGKLGQAQSQSFTSEKSWQYNASLVSRTSNLKRQLRLAESRLRSTGEPELTVLTILSLIDVYKEHRGNITAEVAKLQQRLGAGCDHEVYGRLWQKAMHDNQLSCADVQSPAMFSSIGY